MIKTANSTRPRKPISKDDYVRRIEMFTTNAIRATGDFRKYLDSSSIDSNNGMGVAFAPSARDFVISGMLSEAEKAAISSMQTSSFILDSREAEKKSTKEDKKNAEKIAEEAPWIEPAIYQSRIDEMTLWERKLTEILVDLIGFRHVLKDEYYRHYALLRERERLVRMASDFRQYHDCENLNMQYQIDELSRRIDEVTSKLDPTKCWYVKSTRASSSARYEVADYRMRLNKVLKWMSPNQKVMVGFTYGSYSVQSGNLHPGTAKIKDEEPTMKALDNHFMRVTMLVNEVVFAAMDAKKIHNAKGWLAGFAKANKSNKYPSTILAKMTRPGVEVGDFVIAYGDLAEVTKIKKSPYGYQGFRVKYLEKPPIPAIPEDEMPARYVKLLYKRKPIANEVRKLLVKDGDKQPSTRLINNALRKQVIEMWTKMGGREFAYGRKAEGAQKMQEYVKKMKLIRLKK